MATVTTEDGRIKAGGIRCAHCDRVVGHIEKFKFDFHDVERPVATVSSAPRVLPPDGEARVGARDAAVRQQGHWWWDERGFLVTDGGPEAELVVTGRFTDVDVRLLTHGEGGVVDILVDGEIAATADLYRPGWFIEPVRVASDLPLAERTITVRARGDKNDAAARALVFVEEFVFHGPQGRRFHAPQPINRGNPYSEVIERYVAAVPAGDLVLEAGGGDRRRCRPGYVNFEFLPFEFADFYGDIQRLPFADDTFSLVFSQAVFEHVPNPFIAAEELIRVTKPGGIILTEAAFMQPLHAAPYHYFNITQWGAQELSSRARRSSPTGSDRCRRPSSGCCRARRCSTRTPSECDTWSRRSVGSTSSSPTTSCGPRPPAFTSWCASRLRAEQPAPERRSRGATGRSSPPA